MKKRGGENGEKDLPKTLKKKTSQKEGCAVEGGGTRGAVGGKRSSRGKSGKNNVPSGALISKGKKKKNAYAFERQIVGRGNLPRGGGISRKRTPEGSTRGKQFCGER